MCFSNLSAPVNKVKIKLVFFVLLVAISFDRLIAQDWNGLRGTDGSGVTTSQSLASANSARLKLGWRIQLGSGYSSVSIADGRVLTMYTSGEQDMLGCFDAKSGETNWECRLDDKFKGDNGSFDGPISTPLIHGGNVYGLSCQGRLICVNSENGKLVWEKSLTKDLDAKMPLYGFASSPLIAAGHLILQVGAEDKLVVAMDPKTGDVKWSCGNDSVNSQSPTLVELDGRSILLAAGGKKLTGISPETGEVLFEFEHGGGNGSAVMPVDIGQNNILMTIDDSFSKAINLRPIDTDKVAASEQWQHRSIKNTYNIPTICNGSVFAFSTRILTCVDPKTGKPNWKSRKPGDGFLIGVNEHIAIVTKQGSVHLATANSEKYDEVSQLKVFDDLVWTVPSFADNAIFIRSLGELARVDIVDADSKASNAKDALSLPMSKNFAALLKKLKSSKPEDRALITDQFLAAQDSFPIIDSDIAHFVYRGPETDVALASDVFGARQERKMIPVDGTDLKYFTMKLEDDQRANYVFLVDFKPQVDKLNSRKVTSSVYAGEMEFAVRLPDQEKLEMSWFAMSNWKEPEYLKNLGSELTGKMNQETIEPEKDDDAEISISVYTPPNYEKNSDTRYPVIFVVPYPGFESSQFVESADYLFQHDSDNVRPAILVIPSGRVAPGSESRIIRFVDGKFRTNANRESRAAVGFGFTGAVPFQLLGTNGELFGAIASQTPLAFNTAGIESIISKIDKPTRIYLDWGRFDMHNPVENWDLRKTSSAIYDALKKNENVQLSGGMVNDSGDWSSWRNRYDRVLSVLTKP